METWDKAVANKVNLNKYDVLTALDYLNGLNAAIRTEKVIHNHI